MAEGGGLAQIAEGGQAMRTLRERDVSGAVVVAVSIDKEDVTHRNAGMKGVDHNHNIGGDTSLEKSRVRV